MFLAPLNYDRFFKKIFSDKWIAKHFLEDFFEFTIEEIEILPIDHKLTNESSLLKFDYRCKVDGEYIIIDMQQWYKQDIVQRFYLYHAANSVLQLEGLPLKKIGNEKTVKDYSGLAPVKTLIWMVHDNLEFISDFSIQQMMPADLHDFISDEALWSEKTCEELLSKRKDLLKIMHNDTKDLFFLRKNQLIFAFQRNIVKNQKIKPYTQWFKFAHKTLDKENKREDFKEFEGDEVFTEMMRKLSHSTLNEEDYTYIHYYEEFEGLRERVHKEGETKGINKEKIATATRCLEKGYSVEDTAEISGLSVPEVIQLKKKLGL